MISTKLLKEICSLPTAPFAERNVVRWVEKFVAARKKLRLSRDRFGNLLIETGPLSRKRPRWIFVAHMDHPGFIARKMLDARTLEADFRGWVKIDYVRGTRVRFFDAHGEMIGNIVEATSEEYDRLSVPNRVKVRVSRPVAPGSPGMFDQGVGRIRGKKFYSRAIDDLGGVASALAMLDIISAKPPASAAGPPIAVLLTRAEEEGFIGAIAAAKHQQLLRKTDHLISIETSAVQPYAQQGNGVIIRIGDRTSIFNSQLSYFLTQQAEQLAKKNKTFKFQRALMPGGTCEATVFDVYGYSTAAACVPLGNYHNMDTVRGKIGPEFIDVNDWRNMVKLFVQIARNGHEFQSGHRPLRQRIEKRFNRLKSLLRST